MYFGKVTIAKTFIYLSRERQKLKELFNFLNKIPILFTEGSARAKLEGGWKSLLNFHMQILREFTIIRLKRREWILEFWRL